MQPFTKVKYIEFSEFFLEFYNSMLEFILVLELIFILVLKLICEWLKYFYEFTLMQKSMLKKVLAKCELRSEDNISSDHWWNKFLLVSATDYSHVEVHCSRNINLCTFWRWALIIWLWNCWRGEEAVCGMQAVRSIRRPNRSFCREWMWVNLPEVLAAQLHFSNLISFNSLKVLVWSNHRMKHPLPKVH